MITGFPCCAGFVYGTKIRRLRPGDKEYQDKKYDGQHKFHFSCALVWVDVFGMILHVDFRNNGSYYDRSIFNDSPIIRDLSFYFYGEDT